MASGRCSRSSVDNDDDQAILVVQHGTSSTYGCIPAGVLVSIAAALESWYLTWALMSSAYACNIPLQARYSKATACLGWARSFSASVLLQCLLLLHQHGFSLAIHWKSNVPHDCIPCISACHTLRWSKVADYMCVLTVCVCADAVSSPGASAGLQSLNGSRGALFNRSRSLTPLGSCPSVTGATPVPVAGAEQNEIKRFDSEHAARLLVGMDTIVCSAAGC